ncbi:MAG TPA: TonB-dependent receptor [Candidatus Limnocylindria bacterium]|nr:TonB-dependent receptor [Candidatus Limnocylindria bacterium]
MFGFATAAQTARGLAVALVLFLAGTEAAYAQRVAALSGTVTAASGPVAGAAVTASASGRALRTTTDAHGAFRFSAVPVGTYELTVSAPVGSASLRVEVPAAGAAVTVSLTPLRQIGHTAVTARPPVRGSGTDVTLSSDVLRRSPSSGNLPNILVQLPGAARGANGVVHINGDHGDINYIVDGVQIPQALNRTIGTEFDPSDIATAEALQGAYPAQYGERFASIITINTHTGAGPPGFIGEINGGSFAAVDTTFGYHTPLGKGSIVVATRAQRSNRGLDPPNFDSPHNNFSNVNQFLRYTLPTGPNFLNWTVTRSYQTYQVPNDVAAGEPATTNDNETQEDLFSTLQFRHPIGQRGLLTFGPSYKRSRIRDFGDPENDFAFGAALNPGLPSDCASALISTGPVVNGIVTNPVPNPNVPFANGTCGYSLAGDRTAIDVGFTLDYENRSLKHTIGFGGLYDATHVAKNYNITLQPGNYLAPIFVPATPTAAYTVIDNTPNVGHLTGLYLQDAWRMSPLYELDYGLRQNIFSVASSQFAAGFAQTSPRIKLTRFFGTRSSAYVYYGRFFTPFSLENVDPVPAYNLNLPLEATLAQFDLKPQRDSVYEIGGHLPLGAGELGLRVMHKNVTDLIDDTQVGVTNLHQDINYQLGRIATQTAYYQQNLVRGGRFYASATHTYSVNKGCETQLLAPCFGAPNDWTPADHDQRWEMTSGLLLDDRHGGWFSMEGEYGSGLSSALNRDGITCGYPNLNTGGPCKLTPHVTFDVEKGFALGHGSALTARIENIFNDRYLVTYLNAQGNHYVAGRTFQLGVRFGGR